MHFTAHIGPVLPSRAPVTPFHCYPLSDAPDSYKLIINKITFGNVVYMPFSQGNFIAKKVFKPLPRDFTSGTQLTIGCDMNRSPSRAAKYDADSLQTILLS